jgi:hypothetical protein
MTMKGIVNNIEYTENSAGNQWTTIDGQRYATYWDVQTKNWRIGDLVNFTPVMMALWSDQPKVLGAQDIAKAT